MPLSGYICLREQMNDKVNFLQMKQKSLEIFPQAFLFILFIRAYPFAIHRI